jgi:hypothetical protein
MTTSQSRTVLDWFRTYVRDKFTSIGQTVDASNLNLPLNNDGRVSNALTDLAGREVELRAGLPAGADAGWQAALDEVWADINTLMPQTIRDTFSVLWTDPDLNARGLLKALLRVVELSVLTVRTAG